MSEAAPTLIADAVGRTAADTLARARSGQIIAVFDSSSYIRFEAGLVCVTARDVDLGPLSLRTTRQRGSDWRGSLSTGEGVKRRSENLWIGKGLKISLSLACLVEPSANSAPISQDRLRATLSKLPAHLPSDPNKSGLARLLIRRPNDALTRRAAPCIAAAQDWFANPNSSDPDWARGLLGLGPGLTPSGDDVLGGILVALHRLERGDEARRLWRTLSPTCATRTNEISAALLQAAARGHGSHALHGALEALISGNDLPSAVARLGQHGHSSGWDSLLGLVLALQSTLTKERTLV